jgi:hypothetical protein
MTSHLWSDAADTEVPMTNRSNELDLELKWEIDRLRSQGYEVCAVAFANREGYARLVTTIDADEDVVALLTHLLENFAEAQKVEATLAH